MTLDLVGATILDFKRVTGSYEWLLVTDKGTLPVTTMPKNLCPAVIEFIETSPSLRGVAFCTQSPGHDGRHTAPITWR